MKKAKYLLFIFAGLLALPACNQSNNGIEYKAGDKQYEITTGDKVYSIQNHYVYKVEKPLEKSPDSFEAWIKVPKTSTGGMIAGNYMFAIGTTNDVTVDWGVDIFGRFRVVWGCRGLDYSFPDVYLNTGEWIHVACIRDPLLSSFSFYLNGELKGVKYSSQRDAVEPAPMVFGSDNRNWTIVAEPFDGDIKEITMYNATLSQDQVQADYNRGSGYIEELKDDCLGNWNLGEQWTKTIVKNEANDNKAYLASQDKYVPTASIDDFDYTILGMPDIQTMVDFPLPRETWYQTNKFLPMMQWVKDNAEKEKIKFCVQVGDIVDDGSDSLQWERAEMGFNLWENDIPYSMVPGNHDYTDNCTKVGATRDLEYMNLYFGEEVASEFEEFGGTFDGGIENSYYLFEAGNIKYCVINLELFPRLAVLRWAGRLCEQFLDRRVIINTHYYNDYYNRISDQIRTSWGPINYKQFAVNNECGDGVDIWNYLVKRYPNIFMTLSGHFCVEDALVRKDYGVNGNPIINVLIDEQCSNHWGGGVSWSTDPLDPIMLMKFNEKKKEIYFRYYSPSEDAVFNLQNQFTLSFADWEEPVKA